MWLLGMAIFLASNAGFVCRWTCLPGRSAIDGPLTAACTRAVICLRTVSVHRACLHRSVAWGSCRTPSLPVGFSRSVPSLATPLQLPSCSSPTPERLGHARCESTGLISSAQEPFHRADLVATVMILVGATLCVVFGSRDDPVWDVDVRLVDAADEEHPLGSPAPSRSSWIATRQRR
jgi:hypothetical protein